MSKIETILDKFEPISLDGMDRVKLMNRVDTKYIFNVSRLAELLLQLSGDYYLLIIGNSGFSKYENQYLDTANFDMYLQHHNGKLNRHKIRFRTYRNTGLAFFETKFKSNKRRTIKSRVEVTNPGHSITNAANKLLAPTGYTADMLQESLKVNFTRITLVSKTLPERVTIDINLNFSANGSTRNYPELAVAELKQSKASGSIFAKLMRESHIQPFAFSKYCLGIATTNPSIKNNNFKYKIHHVNKLCQKH
jgi:hypothetical protein